MPERPTVFISYAHESDHHAARVLAFADQLVDGGLDVILDQYDPHPAEGWPLWMQRGIDHADFVLMVCSPAYQRRVMRQEKAGRGLGVQWEGNLIYNKLYADISQGGKYIPILLTGFSAADVPEPAHGFSRYNIDAFTLDDPGYERLYRHLTGQPATPKPEPGSIKTLPPGRVKAPTTTGRPNDPSQTINSSLLTIHSSLFLAPHARNPFFTGRDEILTALRDALVSSGRTGLIQAIAGMGGLGKTQTAIEYCYRHFHDSRDYDAVLWAQADSTATLLASYERIATALGLGLPPTASAGEARDAVKKWLEQPVGGESADDGSRQARRPTVNGDGDTAVGLRYLLVLDNADEPAIARDFIPKNPAGHILITSRAHNLGVLGVPRSAFLPAMPPDKAVAFLLERAARTGADEAEKAAAATLAAELGYLPLALEQAAAYVDDKESRYDTYLASFRLRRLKLLGGQLPVWGDTQKTVATTWSISIEAVRKNSPAAADLLTASAFLAPDRIPEEIFTRGGSRLGPALAAALKDAKRDPALLDEVLAHLTRYSLIVRDRDNRGFDMHRLVQEAVRSNVPADERRTSAERIASAMAHAVPGKEYKDWPACERLLPHWLVVAEMIETERVETADAAGMLNQAAYYLDDRARYAEAEPLYVRALAIREKALGPDHPDTAQSLNNLAALYDNQGRYTEAEPLYVRALAIDEKALGPDHPSTATDLNNLARLYDNQGRYTEAEPLYVRALAIREKALGPDHPGTAQSLNNLAALYDNQGRYTEAEPLYVRALAIDEKALGPDHPSTATDLNNLARLYDNQGRYAEAEPLFVRALAIREQALGPDHPGTAQSLNNLALLYYNQGRYAEAEPLYVRALAIREKALGPDHPRTATSLNNLAGLYDNQGRYTEAEPLYVRALAIREKALGPDHPDTALSLNNLAALYRSQSQYAEAEPLFVRALAIREQALGPDHPWTISTLENYANLLDVTGRVDEAAAMRQRAADGKAAHEARNGQWIMDNG